jgi:2'-5' RNA ligase
MAFLGIKVPEQTGRLLNQIKVPGKKESISEYHVTMLYFGENYPIKEVSKTLEATYEALEDVKPFLIKTSRVESFPKPEHEPCAIIARVDSEELHELNDKLKKKFDKVGVEYSKKFKDFKPHITLAYADDEIDKIKIETVQFEVTNLVLWAGDYGGNRLFVDFLLKGPQKEKEASYLLQKADFFCKVAENQEQAYFTSTVERRLNERSTN